MAALNRAAAELNDDVLMRLECNHAGLLLALFDTNGVGSERVQRIDFDYDEEGLRRIERH